LQAQASELDGKWCIGGRSISGAKIKHEHVNARRNLMGIFDVKMGSFE
jgi:hypothetical protein